MAVTSYEAVSIAQPGERRTERYLPDSLAPAVQPRQVVTARWYCTEDGRLEARWLPTIAEEDGRLEARRLSTTAEAA
jgi:hypothetical protein